MTTRRSIPSAVITPKRTTPPLDPSRFMASERAMEKEVLMKLYELEGG